MALQQVLSSAVRLPRQSPSSPLPPGAKHHAAQVKLGLTERIHRVESQEGHRSWPCRQAQGGALWQCKALSTDEKPAVASSAEGGSRPEVLVTVLSEMERMGHTDTDLISRPAHYFWVGSAVLALLGLLVRGVEGVADPAGALGGVLAAALGYVLADFGTGVYHFGVDNYGSASTPVFGPQIDAFQGHHRRPWTITKRQFANNLQALARPVLFTVAALALLPPQPSRDIFLSVFFAGVMFSQQFHAWAHTPKNLLPPLVVALQDAGVLVSRKMHGAHHRVPFNCNYCIVSGICNSPLDSIGFFAGLEKLIYQQLGVPPRSWSADLPAWMHEQDVSYYEDGTDIME